MAKRLPGASIIHGDASNQALLESEGIQDCDALITMTGMDEQNIIISLYGNNCGVPQVITKVGHLDHTKIIRESSYRKYCESEGAVYQCNRTLCACNA